MPVAIGAFVAFDVFIIAIVLTLWVLATAVMLRPVILFFANMLSDIPAVGDDLANALRNLAGSIEDWLHSAVQSAYNAGARPVIQMMNTYADAHSGDMYSQRLLNTHIVNSVVVAAEAAHNRVNAPTQTYVTNTASTNNTYVLANTDAAVTESEGYTQASYGQLAEWANNAIQLVYQDVIQEHGAIQQVATSVEQVAAQAREYTDATAAVTERNAVDLAGAYTFASFKTGEDYTTQVRDYSTTIVAHEAVARREDVSHNIDELDSKIAVALTGLAAGLSAITIAFADFMTNCGEPLCEDALPFAKGLKDTKNLLGAGLMIAFLVECIRDPEGTADVTVAVSDTITGPVMAIASDVFGVG